MTEKRMNWLLWQSAEDAGEWSKDCAKNLSRLLGPILAGSHSEDAIRIALDLPSFDKAKAAWNQNVDLRGELSVCIKSNPDQPLRLQIPLPFNGVFFARRQDAAKPLSLVWGSWLGEAPGFRIVRPTSKIRRDKMYSGKGKFEEVEWRIGLPRGYFIGAQCRRFEDLNSSDANRLLNREPLFFCNAKHYPEWLREKLGNYGPRGYLDPKETHDVWRSIHETVLRGSHDGTDQDDLKHRVLVTFPIWLKWRICDQLWRFILKGNEESRISPTEIKRQLLCNGAMNEEDAASIWADLLSKFKSIAYRLVPLHRTKNNQQLLHYVNPINPVDLAARLTRVKRFNLSGRAMAEIPAEFRQNHPSFRGCLCPVESPESELVGLTLQLARGATIDSDGRIIPGSSNEPIDELGYGASLVPFFQHNDGTRNMMGSKNLRQALPVAGRKVPMVRTGGEASVTSFTRGLTDLGICSSSADETGELALGIDLLVAYLPWYGMNFEDAIVVGKHVIDSGDFDVEFSRRFRKQFKIGWEPRTSGSAAIFRRSEEEGLAKTGDRLCTGSVIARLSNRDGTKSLVITYNERSPAVLKSIHFHRAAEWMNGFLEYEYAKHFPLRIGDKLMGRHGNKGVVGAIVETMPCLPENEALPKALRGRRIDVLLNPHGVISRMNVGQLLETHMGWLLHSGLYTERDLLKNDAAADKPIGHPFAFNIDHNKVRTLLCKTGLDNTGRIQLVLPDGQMTMSPVAVGFQHIVRLKHIPEEKAQARKGGVSAHYSRKTGQAVHGRMRGGGQRVGEMEVWALAGHRAEYILEEMLGGKADGDWAARWLEGGKPPEGSLSNGFPAMMHDWLYSLLIKADAGDGEVRLSIAKAEDIRYKIGIDRIVESGGGVNRLTLASFLCHRGTKSPCGYSLPIAKQIAVRTPRRDSKDIPSLKLSDLLRHLDLKPAKGISRHGKQYICRLQSSLNNKDAGLLLIQFEAFGDGDDQLKASIQPGIGKYCPAAWPKDLDTVFAYGRFYDKKSKANIKATDLLEQLMDPSGKKRQIGDFNITCPRHKTVPLRATPPFSEILSPEPKGLFDTAIFGSLGVGGGSWSDRQWGLIELPVEVPYPMHVFLSPMDSWKRRSEKENQEKAAEFLNDLGVQPDTLPRVKSVPVLPAHYRMPLFTAGEPIDDPLVKKGYRPLIDLCGRYQSADSDEERAKLLPRIQHRVEFLFGLLVEALRNKTGLIRHDGLGRRVDRSARLVIAPNPSLHWNQVGVPAAVLLELLGDQVRTWLEKCQRSKDLDDRIRAAMINQDKMPDIEKWSWWHSSKDENLIGRAKPLLDEFLKEHPDLLVLLNRQPSLHRDSFQAFHPLALGPGAGDTLQLCPLSCKGFGADFDGDEMVIHFPVSREAQEEAKRLLPSNNLFSLATGEVMAHFDQDFVMGSYWLHEAKRFRSTLPKECCRKLIRPGRIGLDAGIKILKHLAKKHSDLAPEVIWTWMKAAFECCTRVGVSFGFYDLLDLKEKVNVGSDLFAEKKMADELDEASKGAQRLVEKTLDAALMEELCWNLPGLHFAAMALSKARGLKQTRQLIGARGFLNPGSACFDLEDFRRFAFTSSLVDGMRPDEAFWASMNSRSSMCDKKLGTGQAGDLSRHLVFALWHFTVTRNDCKSAEEERGILTCKSGSGCCSLCYGPLPDGTYPSIGFPAGLIAAQSIGERGTQLSMQSFHTGKQAFTIKYVRDILKDKKLFLNPNGARKFVAKLKKKGEAYEDVHGRHFQILWRVIAGSKEHSLQSAIRALSPMTRIAFQNQAREILTAALSQDKRKKRSKSPLADPVTRVIYGLFGERIKLINTVKKNAESLEVKTRMGKILKGAGVDVN